jgi:hypothetical protein
MERHRETSASDQCGKSVDYCREFFSRSDMASTDQRWENPVGFPATLGYKASQDVVKWLKKGVSFTSSTQAMVSLVSDYHYLRGVSWQGCWGAHATFSPCITVKCHRHAEWMVVSGAPHTKTFRGNRSAV